MYIRVGFKMGKISITGALIIIIGWLVLIEFDRYPEVRRRQIMQQIRSSPKYILLIALLPAGILLHFIGAFFELLFLVTLGTVLIFLQGIIVAILFWKIRRWKSILLFIVLIILGIFATIVFASY